MDTQLRLIDIKTFEGTITLESGLHIGSGDMEMHIGGVDNPVIRHPYTMEPYIPGSSIKGKVRSLLETRYGFIVDTKGEPLSYKVFKKDDLPEKDKEVALNILKIFGTSGADEFEELGPTRVIFCDCHLNEDWRKKARDNNWSFTEIKAENRINRITGTAQDPRFMERVPAGTEFDLLVKLKVLNEGEEEELERLLLEGLKLLEMDALGGSGSRGYGRIRIEFKDPILREKFDSKELFVEEDKEADS